MKKTLAGIISVSAIGLASLGFSGCVTESVSYGPYQHPPIYQPAPPIIIKPYGHHHQKNIYISPRPTPHTRYYIPHRQVPIHRPIGPLPHHHPHGRHFR